MKIVNNFEKHFVTYGDNKFNIQKKRLSHQARNFEIFNQIHVYGKKDLSKSFVDKYFKILKNSIGGGYWLWKPYVIQDVLSKTNENDIILQQKSKIESLENKLVQMKNLLVLIN